MKIKTLIIDDEPLALTNVIRLLNELNSYEFEIATASDIPQAIDQINLFKPNLVLADVQLKTGLSFEVFKNSYYQDFEIVFISAFNSYAIQAFKLSAIDYILKPIDIYELNESIKRYAEKQDLKLKANSFFINALENNLNDNLQTKTIVLKSGKDILNVSLLEIIYCEADNNYTKVFINNNKTIIYSKPLKKIEEMFKGLSFIRIHQSFLVNSAHIQKLEVKDNQTYIKLKQDISLPVSKRSKALVIQFLKSR